MSDQWKQGFNDPKGITHKGLQGLAFLAKGPTVPADASTGYGYGCIFWDDDSATLGSQLYINEGSGTSSSFRPLTGFGGGRGTVVLAGTALTLTAATHRGKTIGLNTLTGSTVTLPAATGTGDSYYFEVAVLATSNSHVVSTAPATDVFIGVAMGFRSDSGNAVLGFSPAATDNTITLNRTTTGSVNLGEHFTLTDVASGKWLVKDCMLSATGAAFGTPFSHV